MVILTVEGRFFGCHCMHGNFAFTQKRIIKEIDQYGKKDFHVVAETGIPRNVQPLLVQSKQIQL